MTIALSGANGFLGWHTRGALRERGEIACSIAMGDGFDVAEAAKTLARARRAVHLAGVNRGTDEEVRDGNVRFAAQFADALRRAESAPSAVVFANSTQAGNGSVYGEAKAHAADIVRSACDKVGAEFVNLHLPNLFGEHGLPFYNAVTATFSHLLAEGREPKVDADRELTLMHAQNAADLLLGNVALAAQPQLEVRETVTGLLARLSEIARVYRNGEIPDISGSFDRDLFNTYRSYTFPAQAPVRLIRHADARGSFFETLRSHGGAGQSSFSTTEPGISRGDHFHRRKVERFTVLAGQAKLSLRKLFSDAVVEFEVSGDAPVSIDMPTMWAHRLVNTGADTLYMSFWVNELFDPSRPDTIAEAV